MNYNGIHIFLTLFFKKILFNRKFRRNSFTFDGLFSAKQKRATQMSSFFNNLTEDSLFNFTRFFVF